MKSAYEIAMEKLNAASGPLKTLSDGQKERVAEIDKAYEAKIAETKLSYDEKLASASPETRQALEEEMTSELARWGEKREKETKVVWNEEDG